MGVAGFMLVVLGGWAVVVALKLAGTAVGMYALALGRLPGRRLRRNVEHPRIWGAGALSPAAGVSFSSTAVIIGAGLITLGHLPPPTFDH